MLLLWIITILLLIPLGAVALALLALVMIPLYFLAYFLFVIPFVLREVFWPPKEGIPWFRVKYKDGKIVK